MSWLFVFITLLLASVDSNNFEKVSVIVPAFNEEETVANVVSVIKELSYVSEIIVVDDGSTDNTKEVAEKAGARLISHKVNQGKGAALTTGYMNTSCDIIAFIDADIHNLTSKKVDKIIKPILDGKTDITKTKFARESGRVTELTAKPLLNFFFPEINFEQPLSGQFAARKSTLRRINFEQDYGIDVGIVLDADAQGIPILEVDIGEIQHDLSPLKDLNLMANEVVRTIINRANKYGRISLIDNIGNFIRMTVLGLSLIILGLFTIFFVKYVPLFIGVIITIIGIIIAIFYLIKLIIHSIKMFKKTPSRSFLTSYVKMHFPVIISLIILLLMISTFIGATTIHDGVISIEPSSRNLVIYSNDDSSGSIYVRGPYIVDSAIENESNIIRMPADALATLGLNYNDTIVINNQEYNINQTRDNEVDILRIPMDAKKFLSLSDRESIQDSRLVNVFEKSSLIYHTINFDDEHSVVEKYVMVDDTNQSSSIELLMDNQSYYNSVCVLHNNSYSIAINNEEIGSFYFNGTDATHNFNYDGHIITIKILKSNKHSFKDLIPLNKGNAINFLWVSDSND